MKLARVTGTVSATVKNAQMVSHTLLVCDLVDAKGKVTEPAVVAVDTVGAGKGEQVLLSFGSAARLPTQTSGVPIDAVIVAIVDSVDIG
jgi:ethanolamine utilization protein EutN